MPNFDPVALLRAKREGRAHSPVDIARLIQHFMQGEVADYQMSAWLMAVLLQGLNTSEMLALTDAMLNSGKILAHPNNPRPKVDKHSTGGVGDKVSICLAPLVASCGVAVPMISGRGLGHTGGTLDKLEAIPGFKVQLSTSAFERQVRKLGVAMIGQTRELAPADRRLYALRDVTATVESIPLIVASILSKKLAEGIDALVLDVKVGRGAFMKDLPRARALAKALIEVGTRAGKRVEALLTNMDTPLGLSIGNAVETREAFEVLHGGGPKDTRELTLALGVEMLVAAGHSKTRPAARAELEQALASGRALELMAQMVHAQGGDSRSVEKPSLLRLAPRPQAVKAAKGGVVGDIDPLELARVALALGAGRTRADQTVDAAAGIQLKVRCGERVKRGDELCLLYSSHSGRLGELAARAMGAFHIGKAPTPRKLIIERRTR